MYNIKGVLFDFDGVIADTMQDNFRAWNLAFQKVSAISILREDFFPLEGSGVRKIAEIIGTKYKISSSKFEEIAVEKESQYLKIHKFKIYSEIYEIIDLLKAKEIKIALVTGASKARLTETTPKEFLDKFNCLVSADDVRHTKPHPEPYEKGIKCLGLESRESIVVENAPLGVRSAQSAGIKCIAITTTVRKEALSQADLVVESFEELEVELYKFIT